MWALSDEALLAGLGAGDPEATTAFVRRHQARVFGVAVGMVRDRALAEEVAQEAFVRAWRHAATYDPRRGTVLTWLLAITHNLAVDALRARRTTPVDPHSLALLDREAGGPGTESVAVTTTELDRVRAALAGLPPDQRRAVVLARFAGLTAVEISDQEGLPLGTVKTRIRTGLARVRAALERAEDGAGPGGRPGRGPAPDLAPEVEGP
jgi:RNA polymerase sigma-70 factor (ECF subfamily)